MIKAAVLGSPISHSLSPALHRAAYGKLGVEGEYSAIDVNESQLPDFIASLSDEWNGFSLTMPLKEVALKVAASVDPISERIASANTLVKRGRGWFATSTDRTGFISLLNSHKLFQAKNILILGAGGTARAALAALDHSDKAISVARRNKSRDESLVRCVDAAQLSLLPWSVLKVENFDLVINTVPGSASEELFPVLDSPPPLIDVIYNPWPTKLAEAWISHQPRVVSGIELLIWQGIDQVELMTGMDFNREEMFTHLFHTLVSVQ